MKHLSASHTRDTARTGVKISETRIQLQSQELYLQTPMKKSPPHHCSRLSTRRDEDKNCDHGTTMSCHAVRHQSAECGFHKGIRKRLGHGYFFGGWPARYSAHTFDMRALLSCDQDGRRLVSPTTAKLDKRTEHRLESWRSLQLCQQARWLLAAQYLPNAQPWGGRLTSLLCRTKIMDGHPLHSA